MANTLTHRGPNESGVYISDNILLGHRRLTVIDPAGGKQPMIKNFGEYKYVIVYNGELYNTDTLMKILKGKGHKFNSYSDTEVLITAYMEWGVECVNYFNGIYAFAIWSEKDKTLFMARDHLGVKPLFYIHRQNSLLFASEIKALLAHPEVEAVIDEQGLCEIFGLGPARTPGSAVFKDIHEIKPGHYIFASESQFYEKEFWDLEAKPHLENLEETAEIVKEILYDSVKRQLVSDVPLCTFLSGGLDSSIISAIAAQEFKKQGRVLHTYSIEYVDNDKYFKANDFQPDSDSKWSNVMVDAIGSKHKIIYVDNDQLVDALNDAVIANDLPGMADVDSSMLLLCKGVAKEHVVALSGECADEVFGGYPWFWRTEDIECNTFPWSKAVNERNQLLSKNLQKINIQDYVQNKYIETINKVPKLDSETPKEHRMREIYYLNHKWFMQTLLNRKDRMSMANGLEARVPFSDKLLVEYAWNIPSDMKYYNNREKGLLRKAVNDLLPKGIIERKKSPFPKTHNPAYTKSVQKWMEEIMQDATSPILQLVDKSALENLTLTGGKAFVKPWYGQLMTGPQLLAYLIQVNTWLKLYNIKIDLN
jgi:asparagine synthase (glutamine-hydrolysing)